MQLTTGTLLLVVDGSQMMLLRNQGDTRVPDLVVMEQRKIDSLSNRELLADAPGVGFASAGEGQDSYAKADPHQVNEDRFVAEAAERLTQIVAQEKGPVIVIAPPKALGLFRKHCSPAVKERLAAEIAKDFSNHPVAEIARIVTAS